MCLKRRIRVLITVLKPFSKEDISDYCDQKSRVIFVTRTCIGILIRGDNHHFGLKLYLLKVRSSHKIISSW